MAQNRDDESSWTWTSSPYYDRMWGNVGNSDPIEMFSSEQALPSSPSISQQEVPSSVSDVQQSGSGGRSVSEKEISPKVFVCSECGYEAEDKDEFEDIGNELVCDGCLAENYTQCDDCDNYVLNNNVFEAKRRQGHATVIVCEQCLSDDYGVCDGCKSYFHHDIMNSIEDSRGDYYTYCNDCFDDTTRRCDKCGEYRHDSFFSRANQGDICDDCWEDLPKCSICGQVISEDDVSIEMEFGHYQGTAHATCFDDPNVESYNHLCSIPEVDVEDRIEYYKEVYPSLYSIPEDYSKKAKKSWNYTNNWFAMTGNGGKAEDAFSVIPSLDIKVTHPSKDYEGAYVEGHVDINGLAGDLGVDAKELYDLFFKFNSNHPCMVSSEPSRMVVMRLATDGDELHVKLMQGSINQEARKEIANLYIPPPEQIPAFEAAARELSQQLANLYDARDKEINAYQTLNYVKSHLGQKNLSIQYEKLRLEEMQKNLQILNSPEFIEDLKKQYYTEQELKLKIDRDTHYYLQEIELSNRSIQRNTSELSALEKRLEAAVIAYEPLYESFKIVEQQYNTFISQLPESFTRERLEKLSKYDWSVEALAQEKDLLLKVIQASNGAYVVAYDWIHETAEALKVPAYIEVPEEQARQHPAASPMSLQMIYGALPTMMGFTKIVEGDENEQTNVGKIKMVKKKKKPDDTRTAQNNKKPVLWSFENFGDWIEKNNDGTIDIMSQSPPSNRDVASNNPSLPNQKHMPDVILPSKKEEHTSEFPVRYTSGNKRFAIGIR